MTTPSLVPQLLPDADPTQDLETRGAASHLLAGNALQQQQQAQPSQQQPAPAQQRQTGGPLGFFRSMLQNMAYGASQAGLKASGLETDAEREDRRMREFLMLTQANNLVSETAMRNYQMRPLVLRDPQSNQPMMQPDGTPRIGTMADQKMLLEQYEKIGPTVVLTPQQANDVNMPQLAGQQFPMRTYSELLKNGVGKGKQRLETQIAERAQQLLDSGASLDALTADPVLSGLRTTYSMLTTPHDTAAAHKQAFEGIIQKLATAGELPANAATDVNALRGAITNSKVLTPAEQASASAYMVANPTPAGQASSSRERMQILVQPREEANQIARERLIGPYVQKAADAVLIDNLANRVMADIQQKGGTISGPEFMQLLSYHMAGTMGAVKGAHTGIELVHEHAQARSWSEALQAMYNKAANGGNVSMQQAQEWVRLAQQRRELITQQAKTMNEIYGANLNLDSMVNQGNKTPPPAKGATGGIKIMRDANGRITGVE